MKKKGTVVLLSGGMDSAVLLAYLLSRGEGPVQALNIGYGQRHEREMNAASQLAARYFGLEGDGCSSLTCLRLPPVFGPSALTPGGGTVPEGHYEDESMRQTVVPGRNAVFLSLAIAHAAGLGYDTVAYAAHAGDHAIYPDCRLGFIGAMQAVAALSHYEPITLEAPFASWTKTRILEVGLQLKVPFELTWTCYNGRKYACGRCGSCTERLEAFREVKSTDPLPYEFDHSVRV